MAGAIHLAVSYMQPQFAPETPFYVQAAALAAVVAGGMSFYFAAVFGLGGADMGMIRRNVKRKQATAPDDDPHNDPA